jgi:hypothetical protein
MTSNTLQRFRILSIGWEPDFINAFLASIQEQTGIDFIHGLVGDSSRIASVCQRYPNSKFIALSKTAAEPLPDPDYGLLASLEANGVPTVRSMVQGDRVLRYIPATEALQYATLLAQRIRARLLELQPDVVLASHDSLHSAMSLAVSRSLGIPWVAMAFSTIPETLTGFSRALSPDALVPMVPPVNDVCRKDALAVIQNVRERKQKVMGYRAPSSVLQWARKYFYHANNLLRRKKDKDILGIDRYTYPSACQRLSDVFRRSFNRLCLPAARMLIAPPDGRFVYFTFHMAPESNLDTWAPFYQDQIAFVAQVSLSIPADAAFVVKLHFSDPDNYSRQQLEQLMSLPRLYIAHPNASGNVFIEKAALVVGIQGTSCLEATLLGKPVLIFGDSPYQHFPRTERAKRPDEVYGQIRRMLDLPPVADDEIIEAYARYMARYMPGRINDWTRPIAPDQLNQYADCFRSLRVYLALPQVRANWYKQMPFAKAGPEDN